MRGLKELRKERNISQQELATLLGCSISHIRGFEKGNYKTMRIDYLEKLKEVLRIDDYEYLQDDNRR